MGEPLDYGHFDIVLAEYLQKRHYSKNNIKRPDLDVLARICHALHCDLTDIIRYVHPSQTNGGNNDG